jgi:hypothetical protein
MFGFHPKRSVAAAFLGVWALAACDDGPTSCPGVVVPAEPILQITGVRDSATGDTIETFTLDEFLFNGSTIPIEVLVNGVPNTNVTREGSALVCHIHCGFGAQSGTYGFRVTAAGYRPATFSVAAVFGEFKTGCPTRWINGTKIVLQLAKY